MPTFCVMPVHVNANHGWVVKTTHDDGVCETSIAYESREMAQKAADSWVYLDADWGKV